MPKEKTNCVEHLRHAEYYDMVSTFDELYEKSSNNEEFIDLMGIILSRENIMLAYRELKANDGSMTPGTDELKIREFLQPVQSGADGGLGLRTAFLPAPLPNRIQVGIAHHIVSVFLFHGKYPSFLN